MLYPLPTAVGDVIAIAPKEAKIVAAIVRSVSVFVMDPFLAK